LEGQRGGAAAGVGGKGMMRVEAAADNHQSAAY